MSDSKPITLIATIGSSPAVLTEAVYALHKNGFWPVVEIEIITTNHGADLLKKKLFGSQGQWLALCKELDIDPFSVRLPALHEIKAVADGKGGFLDDIRSREEDQRMASAIQQVVRMHTTVPDKRVFALLSGGRKTMSSHIMSAMQLYSRRDDRLIHLLVNEPFERIRSFYFPTRESAEHHLTSLSGDVIGTYDSKNAKIDLIDIPYIRLRSYLSKHLDYSKSFGELIAEADSRLLSADEYPVHDLHIHLNGQESGLYINGKEHLCKLEPRQLAMLATYVWLNKEQGKPYDISWHDIVKEEERRNAMSVFYRTAVEGNYAGADLKLRRISIEDFNERDEWRDYEYWHDENDEPLRKSYSKQKSQLVSALRLFLSENPGLNLSTDHLWVESGSARKAVRKLNKVPVPADRCRITGLHDEDAERLGLDDQDSE
ncbi:MAG: TIGR02584 family CRISPR-associated protein [Balneolia bacterium]|nr:TIGR02584 family CRISPR-associated protein [Balneolia bacterium]